MPPCLTAMDGRHLPDQLACLRSACGLACIVLVSCCAGCGTTKSYTATEQLLISDAVDTTIAKLDFTPMQGRRVYLDTTYVKTQKSPLLIDSDYVISSLRQQMVSAGVQLVEARDEAELIAEARMGALGLDGHNVTYGMPASNALSTATSVFTNAPNVPAFPEISVARHEAKSGAAKIAVFAYDRETREPFWQSGIARSSSSARDTWVLGVGPWQKGSIYDGTRFAGSNLGDELSLHDDAKSDKAFRKTSKFADYIRARSFGVQQAASEGDEESQQSAVVPANAEDEAAVEAEDS